VRLEAITAGLDFLTTFYCIDALYNLYHIEYKLQWSQSLSKIVE